jgi:tetratricopeptide (TPR) repeat protein
VVQTHPRLPEGRSALGICLLQLGDYDAAFVELKEAAALQPAEALHQWNLAACAKQCERVGGAYLALREYLQLKDDAEGADERRNEARSYVRSYVKMLRDCHPDVSLADYLRGEELFARAYAALSEQRSHDAIRGFEAVLALVPRHYPSWGNLGIAQLQLGDRVEAVRCFERALELNPNYTQALQNLAALAET